MSKGDEFRKKYSADIRAYLSHPQYRTDRNWRDSWIKTYAKKNMKQIMLNFSIEQVQSQQDFINLNYYPVLEKN